MSEEELFVYRFILIALFGSLFTGFVSALILLHMLDSRVFDENGKQIPGPIHYLWGRNYMTVLRIAQATRQYSKAVYEILLSEIGDGNISAFWSLAGFPQVIIGHPDMVKSILSAHQLKFQVDDKWGRLRDLFGSTPITCPEKSWNKYKNVTTPVFRSHTMKGVISVFNIHARRILRHWHFRLNKLELQMDPRKRAISTYIDDDFRHVMIGVMCEAGFGYDFYINAGSKDISDDFETIVNECISRMGEPTDWWHKLYQTRQQKVKSAVQRFREVIGRIHKERVEARAKQPDDHQSAEHRDLLDLVMESNEQSHPLQQLSGEDIVDSVISFMFLGFESTAATMMWVIYELALHADIQARCAKEVDSIMKVNGVQTSAVLYEDIPRFSVLIQVLKETLRLHPPVPEVIRKCTAPCRVGEYCLKKGSRVAISVLALHKHPDYWYLPNQFFPDRFSQENVLATMKNPFQYIPFGGGARNCIGQRFGQMAVVVVLAVLLSKFSFHFTKEDLKNIIFEEKMCLYPTNMRVSITARPQTQLSSPTNNDSPTKPVNSAMR